MQVDPDHSANAYMRSLGSSEAVQIAAIAGNTTATYSAGQTVGSQHYSADLLAPSYCMSRIPLLAAVLLLSEGGHVDVDAEMSTYVKLPFVPNAATINDVLNHEAGLSVPDLVTWRMSGGSVLVGRAVSKPLTPRGYSDYLPGIALSSLIESLAGCTAEEYIVRELFEPAGVQALLRYDVDGPLINPAIWGLPDRYVPLLSEELPDQIALITPATGIFGCAEGFARLLSWLFVDGPGAESRQATLIGASRDAHWDPVLQRVAKYSFGFMSDMSLLDLPNVSSHSFGHTAAMAGWIAVVEPLEGVVWVGYSNGVLRSQEDGEVQRELLLKLCADCQDGNPLDVRVSEAKDGQAGGPIPESLEKKKTISTFLRLAEFKIGMAALPVKCDFTVLVTVADVESALLLFRGGALAGIYEMPDSGEADVEIVGADVTLRAWLDQRESRLGPMLVEGTVRVAGRPWVLSGLEYWATNV